MRVIRNILSQLHVYTVWLILSAVLWGFVFGLLTDAPPEKKLLLFAEVEHCEDTALSARLEEEKPAGIRLIRAHSFDYVMLDEAALRNADLYIVKAENIESYRDSFLPLDPGKIDTAGLTLYESDGEAWGIRVRDREAGCASAYLSYGEGEYYLFLGANSPHAGEKDDAAYWLIGEILKMQ